MQPALIVTYGNTSRKRRPLDKPVLVLGRVQGCDMPLMSPDVAPVHCLIVKLANGWHIRDCSGHLGTRVNGKNVTEEPLTDEDHLQIGPFNFKVHLPARPEQSPPVLRPGDPVGAQTAPVDEKQTSQQRQSRENLVRLARAYREQAQAALKEHRELKSFLDRDVQELTADREDLDRDWQQLEKSARALRVRELDMEKAEKALRERFIRVEEELADLRKQGTASLDRVQAEAEAAFREKHAEALAEVERAKHALADQREHLEHQCEDLDSERIELEKMRGDLDQARLDLEGLRCQAEADHSRAQMFLKQTEDASLQIAERERHLALRTNELDAYAAELSREKKALAERAESLAQPPSIEPTSLENSASEIQNLQQRIGDLEQENRALLEQAVSQSAPGQIQVLRVEDESLRKSLDESRQQLDQYRLIADALQRENEELRKKIPTTPTPEKVLGAAAPPLVPRSDLEASEAAYAALQMQFKRLQVERDQERSRTRESVDNLRQENELLRANSPNGHEVGATEVAAAALQTQLKRVHTERAEESARFRAQIEELRQEVEILRQEANAETTSPHPALDDQRRSDTELAAVNKEADRLRQRLKEMHEENELLKQQINAPATVPAEELEQFRTPADNQVNLAEECQNLKAMIEQLREENRTLRESGSPGSDPVDSMPITDEELRHQVEVLKDRLVEMQIEHEVERKTLEQQLQAARSDLPSILQQQGNRFSEAEIQEFVAHLDNLQQENEQLIHELKNRQNQEVELNSKIRTISLLEQQLQTVQSEMNRIQTHFEERERDLASLREQVANSSELKTIQSLRQAIGKLEGDLKDRDILIEKLSVELDSPASGSLEISGGYERELHQFRLELERDRRHLDEQLTEIRQREMEIEDAARETELQLARDRASLARERNDLTRMREEIRMDQERLDRQVNNRAGVGSVGSLRDVFAQGRQDQGSGSSNGSGNSNGKRR